MLFVICNRRKIKLLVSCILYLYSRIYRSLANATTVEIQINLGPTYIILGVTLILTFDPNGTPQLESPRQLIKLELAVLYLKNIFVCNEELKGGMQGYSLCLLGNQLKFQM